MKTRLLVVAFLAFLAFQAFPSPASAQIGGLGGTLKKAQQVQQQKQNIDDLTFSDAEERQIGEEVSEKIRQRFGVAQDSAVHKYVALVGTTVARASERPSLAWTFIVLDTDGVNAFASPGGLVHITRGALGLIRNEAELAGVLAHEIGHVTHKHTINAIRKNKAVQLGTHQALADRAPLLDKMANRAYELVLENSFDRGDQLDADKVSVELTGKPATPRHRSPTSWPASTTATRISRRRTASLRLTPRRKSGSTKSGRRHRHRRTRQSSRGATRRPSSTRRRQSLP